MATTMDSNHRMIAKVLKDIEKQLACANILKTEEIALTKFKLGAITADAYNATMKNLDAALDEIAKMSNEFSTNDDLKL